MANVRVVMLATPEIETYAVHTKAVWRRYCAQHAYEFEPEAKRLLSDMHVNWSKIALIQRHLNDARVDTLLLTDADTIVVDQDRSIESLFSGYDKRDIIFCPDTTRRFGLHWPLNVRGAIACRSLRPPNAGFILIRNGPFAVQFFQDWLASARSGPLARWADKHPRNQNVLWRGPYRAHRDRVGVFDKEVGRVGVDQALDRISLNSGGAFVLHDKRFSRDPKSAERLIAGL
ncbi:MAG: hypothetical protein AAF850_00480 [Pseudomonadota bacterium]